MAVTILPYNHLTTIMLNGSLGNAESATVMLALVTDSYTFDATDTQWADVSANEVANGDGYTTGGAAIASLAVTDLANGTAKLDGADVTWSALTKTFYQAVAYADGTFGALTDPVLFRVLYDSTPANVTITGIDFVTAWNAAGILYLG